MTDQSVFSEQESNSGTPTQTSSTVNPFEDQLKGITNEEGKQKYATLEEALKGLAHAQSYIPELKDNLSHKEQEIARLQAELQERKSVEDVVSRLASQGGQPAPESTPQAAQGLTIDEVDKLVEQRLQAVQQQSEEAKLKAKEQDNITQVSNALAAKFGDKASEVVGNKAKELGMSSAELQSMAGKNPNLVLTLFNTQTQAPKPTTTSVNIPPVNPSQPELARPEKSLLLGATSKQQKEYYEKVKADVYARLNIQG